ncbi:MAG: UDP-N-acetylmuramate dehydrogenase [Bacteroidetes bacterium]|nr:UDP-N-acetylmuramate dehydrogenase [Bacteroidota bacterium]
MNLKENISLKQYNTFGIDVLASYFATFSNTAELATLLSDFSTQQLPKLVLGGGSNILFTRNFDGLVLKNEIQGIEVIEEDASGWLVKAGAGINWHSFVTWCIDKGYAGIENLSLIPGNVGASPIQNIGAYGVEQKDSFHQLEAVDILSGEKLLFNKEECDFGYRDSIFKRIFKGKLIITSVTFALKRIPDFNTTYGAIDQELKKMGVTSLSIKSISEAVCNIRRSKLPNPAVIGNAGSFFKNPEVSNSVFNALKISFPGIVGYELASGNFKLAAGWLIEQCGWKGKRVGNTGSHKDQALVLINYGNASGTEIWDLAMSIQASVKDKFDVLIEPEVNIM